jgi:hypothetical protein
VNVSEWIKALVKEYMTFFPNDWPTGEDETRVFLARFVADLDALNALHAEASRAVQQLASKQPEHQPRFRPDYLPALTAQIRANRGASQSRADMTSASESEFDRRAEARWNSFDPERRAEWRALVRERFPNVARDFGPTIVERVAIACAANSTLLPAEGVFPPAKPKGDLVLGPRARRRLADPEALRPAPNQDGFQS